MSHRRRTRPVLPPLIVAAAVIAVVVAGCAGASPASAPAASPVPASAAPAVAVAPSPVLTPIPGEPVVLPVPGAGLEPTETEAELLAGARLDLQGMCGPVRDGLPAAAQGAIGCSPSSRVASSVSIAVFDTADDLQAAYREILEAEGIELQVREELCTPGLPSETSYLPGDLFDGPYPERIACRIDDGGIAHVIATSPPFHLLRVDGQAAAPPAEVNRYVFLGNLDQPGGPTLWAEQPVNPEK